MSDISRYYVRYESEYLEHDVDGKFMLYEDHLAIVNEMKGIVLELESRLRMSGVRPSGVFG